MSVILSRDSTLYLSTVATGHSSTNTTKLNILDGYKLTQSTEFDNYSTFRQSNTPSRLEIRRVKDISLVTLEFSTYAKTKLNAGLAEPSDLLLWNTLTNNGSHKYADRCEIDFLVSKTNTFPNLYIYLAMDNDTFRVNNCYVESVNINFNIDNIIQLNWKVKAISYEKVSSPPALFLDRTERTGFLKGRLSIMEFNRQSQAYNLPLLSGELTISNKIVPLSTPIVSEQLATNRRVKIEERSVEGDISVYLRNGSGRSMSLLSSMLASIATINDLTDITINLGGGTGRRLAIQLPTTIISLPNIDIKDVVSTKISLSPIETAVGANDDIKLIFYN